MSKFIDLNDDEDLKTEGKKKKKSKKQQTVYNIFILDRSSSMESVKAATISGFNEQLQTTKDIEKKHKKQKHYTSLITFASDVKIDVWNASVNDFLPLDHKTYQPAGCTALNDAIAMAVIKLRDEIKDRINEEDINVLVTILTDGFENNSREFRDTSKLADLIKGAQDTKKWKFSFIGADEDIVLTAKKYNIAAHDTLQYSADVSGTKMAFGKYASSRVSYSDSLAKGLDVTTLGFFDDKTVEKKEQKKDKTD